MNQVEEYLEAPLEIESLRRYHQHELHRVLKHLTLQNVMCAISQFWSQPCHEQCIYAHECASFDLFDELC